MPVTMATADQALKILYLGVVTDQLNTNTNPLYNEIKSSTKDISGKEVRKMAPWGVNGGVGAGTETGALPGAGGNNYTQFVSTTKNLYGTVEMSDKSIQASRNNAGAFVNLLNNELEGLMRASKFNFGRMVFTDGSGILATCGVATTVNLIPVSTVKYLMEGMTIDICASTGVPKGDGAKRRIMGVDRKGKKILVSGAPITTAATDIITVQNSYNLELTGLKAIFKDTGKLYDVDRAENYWMVPYMQDTIGIISDIKIQKAIDYKDEIAGSKTNFICCSSGVKRSYQEYLEATKRNVNTMELKGGFTAISYNGIPLVSDRFQDDGTMDLLDTSEFTFHHMGDWRWIEDESGKVLKQLAGFPIYQANLVKYAELICDKPLAQARLSGITEDDGIA